MANPPTAASLGQYDPAPQGMKWIFPRYITNRKTGQRVYPKNAQTFAFLVPDGSDPAV